MGILQSGLNLYRKTIKQIHPLHVGVHWLLSRTLIPILENTKGFKTIEDDPFWFRLELLLNKHEAETTLQIDRLTQAGMVVLDVGAHVGYYARRVARLVGKDGRVVAFEPHPKTFATLSRNTVSYGNVTPLQIAVSDRAGIAELYDYLMMSASGSLHYDEALSEVQRANQSATDFAPRMEGFETHTYTVETRLIDTCLEELKIEKVDLIKMDIEGAELSALRGARETISRSENLKLIMEFNPQALSAFGHEPVQALQEVQDLGFGSVAVIETDGSLSDITGNREAIVALSEKLMARMDVVNLLFEKHG